MISIALTGCGGSSEVTPLVLDRAAEVRDLSATDKQSLCDWLASTLGSTVEEYECGGIQISVGVNRTLCPVDDFGTCTVGIVEDCSILLHDDPCNYDEDACWQYIECYLDF